MSRFAQKWNMTGAALLCAWLTSGCASWFIHGGDLVKMHEPLPGEIAKYSIDTCVDGAGATVASPPVTYHLMNGKSGPEFFERDGNGKGVLISNRWQEPDGVHYFAWGVGMGWEYVLPAEGEGVRKVYQHPGGRDESDGTRRPVVSGPPAVTCRLRPT